MKILFIIPEDIKGIHWGGVTTYTVSAAQQLSKMGHEVNILTPGNINENYYDYSSAIFRIDYLIKNRYVYLFLKLIGCLSKKVADRITWMINVLIFVKNNNYSIIESPEWGSSSLLISIFTKTPVVVKLHRSWHFYLKDNEISAKLDDYIIFLFEYLSILLSQFVISPTKFMLDRYPLVKIIKKTQKIDYGINFCTTINKRKSKFKKFIFSGRLEKAKGCDILIKAFAIFTKKYPQYTLHLYGEDTLIEQNKSYKAKLKKLIKRMKIKNISIHERIKNKEIKKILNTAAAIIVPSINCENQPLAILEGFSTYTPVIGSNTGGIPETVSHGVNGLIFLSKSYLDLANKMEMLISNNQLIENLYKDNATKSRFDIINTTQQNEKIYLFLTRKK